MGQSSSRPQPSNAGSSHERRQPQRRRLRPASTVFGGSSRAHPRLPTDDPASTSNATEGESTPSRSRPRSIHLPDLLNRSWPERRQVRSRSPAQLARHSSRRAHNHLARRIFTRHYDQQEEATTTPVPWNAEPRDSLDMARAARDRDEPRLPDISPSPLDLDFTQPAPPPMSPSELGPSTSRPNSSLANRISALTPARELSRLTASIRRRRGRHSTPAEENAAMLQRLLSVAAAATAASLMGGNPEAAVNDLRRTAVAVDGEDGSFDNFLQALRNGRLASHLGRNSTGNGDGSNGNTGDSNTNSLDFFRMFRFGPSNASSVRRSAPAATTTSSTVNNDQNTSLASDTSGSSPNRASDPETRTVSILIVGIRSLNQDADPQTTADGTDAMPSFIDALTNLNTTINVGLQDAGSDMNVGSPGTRLGLSALARRRRASMGGLFTGADRTRRPRLSNIGRPLSEIGPSSMPADASTITEGLGASSGGLRDDETQQTLLQEQDLDDVPEIPQETSGDLPSFVPAIDYANNSSPILSSRSSSRARLRESWRQSWRDSWHSSRSRNDFLSSNRRSVIDSVPEDDQQPPSRWSRRRSQSDALRYGSGSSRRNGVVEPDHLSADGNRSWIIYVLGGSYPEDHPILTTPSLFTENPTYEDMLLLSSLLGPAKPPVAQQEDVDSSGGLFQFETMGEKHVARAALGDQSDDGYREIITIEPSQQCLICLCTYAESEIARRLGDCGHLFHRECIDEWLTTGRNSCPLCRGQGVVEHTPPPDPNINMSGAPSSSRGAAAAAAAAAGTSGDASGSPEAY